MKKGVLRNFKKFTVKHLCHRPWACNYIKKETLALVLSCEFCKISKNTFFTEHLWTAASQLFKNTFFYRTFPVAAAEDNEQQQLSESFANISYKIVSQILLQELINDFAVCKQCSGTLLLVEDSHDFGN